jgi:UDP:flavonoid glycosyltransferase YjiC (YdhE family)
MKKQSGSDILLCAIGSAGDAYPFLGLGLGLRKRGYRVTLITSQFFEIHTRDAGLEFFGLGSAEDYQSIAEKLNTVITSRQVLDRCKSYARKINPDQALNDTCTSIEDFARNQMKKSAHNNLSLSYKPGNLDRFSAVFL